MTFCYLDPVLIKELILCDAGGGRCACQDDIVAVSGVSGVGGQCGLGGLIWGNMHIFRKKIV